MYKIITVISFLVIIGIVIAIPNVYAVAKTSGTFEYEDSEIKYSIQGSVSDMIIDGKAKSLTVKMISYGSHGMFLIWLPTDVIDAKSGSSDVEFTVLKNGQLEPHRCKNYEDPACTTYALIYGWKEMEKKSSDIRVLFIYTDLYTTEIEIVGTHVLGSSVPEPVPESMSKIPEWVRNIFIWYGENRISEDELLNAIQFLLDQGILKSKT